METTVKSSLPTADQFVDSPLRSRIRLALNAPLAEVWETVGDPGRMPEYSEGLQKVETKWNASGHCTAYQCHFKEQQPGAEVTNHRAIMQWYAPLKGWASTDEEPNDFGLTQSLTFITLEAQGNKTMLKWDMHFNSENMEIYKADLEEALNQDIAQRLIQRFGGQLLESFIEESPSK